MQNTAGPPFVYDVLCVATSTRWMFQTAQQGIYSSPHSSSARPGSTTARGRRSRSQRRASISQSNQCTIGHNEHFTPPSSKS